MENHPVLCGGTLLTLIWESLKEEVVDKENPEVKRAPKSPQVYKDLISCVGARVDDVDMTETFKQNVSKYKNCSIDDGRGLIITNAAFRESFKEDFLINREVYSTWLKEFVGRYFDENGANLLLRRLAALIDEDESLPPTALQRGNYKDRQEPIALHNLLLNTLRFIIIYRPDNKKGKETIKRWLNKSPESRNAVGKYQGELPVENYQHLRVSTQEESNLQDLLDFEYNPDPIVPPQLLFEDLYPGNFQYGESHFAGQFYDPRLFESDNPIYNYLLNARERYRTAKTLLYRHEPKEFYAFYEVADLKKAGGRNNPVISNIDAVSLQDLDQYMIIYGTGGLGKSMMLRHLFLSTIDHFNELKLIPLFVSLKDYKDPKEKLLSFCFHQMDSVSKIEYEDFVNLLMTGKLAFFFDGYDELKSSFVGNFDYQLNELIARYPKNRYILSSRPTSSFIQLEKLTLYNLMPLSKEQAINMIKRQEFYRDDLKERLIKDMETTLYETHKAFIENPLLLMILLISYERFGQLPTSRSAFYENAFRALVWEHDSTKPGFKRELSCQLNEKEFRELFAQFCMQTYSDEEYEFDESTFLETMDYVQETCPSQHLVRSTDFMEDCTLKLCLIIKDEPYYHFIHRSFQEFFAAVFLAEQVDEENLYEDMEIISRLHEESALNVFRFAHEINYKTVEKFGIIPFLEDFLGGSEYEDGYEEYLTNLYPRFTFGVGECPDDIFDAIPSIPPIYALVREINKFEDKCYGGNTSIGEEDLPFSEAFISRTFGNFSGIEENEELYFYKAHHEITDFDSPPDWFDGEPEICGYEVSIKTSTIFKHPERYPEIYKFFMDDEFKPRYEFLEAKTYLRNLKKDRQKSRSALLESRKRRI